MPSTYLFVRRIETIVNFYTGDIAIRKATTAGIKVGRIDVGIIFFTASDLPLIFLFQD